MDVDLPYLCYRIKFIEYWGYIHFSALYVGSKGGYVPDGKET